MTRYNADIMKLDGPGGSVCGDSLQYRLEQSVLSPCEWHWTVKVSP